MSKQKTKSELAGKNLLLVSTGTPKKSFILQKLKNLGVNLIVLEKEVNWAKKYVKHWILADTNNDAASIRAVKNFLQKNKKLSLDGVLTFWEDSVILTSKLVDELKLIGVPATVAEVTRNKANFRKFCKKHNIKTPAFSLVEKKEDLSKIAQQLTFPLVIKPVYGASSAFVVKVDNLEQLRETYQYLQRNVSTQTESALENGLGIYVEEYIDGDEVDIDIIVQNGKIKFSSISDNFQTREPFFIEPGSAVPSSLPLKDQKALVMLAEETLEKLGIMNGCIHFEAKSTKNGPVPIEVNLRMGGDEVYSFSKEAWGFDLIEHAAKVAAGVFIKFEKPSSPKKYLVQQAFLSDNSGILVELNIDPQIKKLNYVQEFHFYKNNGDAVLAPPEGYEPLGWISVWGDNPNDAEDNLEEAVKLVDYQIIKFDPASSLGRTSRHSRFSVASLRKDILLGEAKMENIRKVSRRSLKKLKVGIACNLYGKSSDDIEFELTQVGKTIEEALTEKGYSITFFDFNNLPKLLDDLSKKSVDVMFNLVERINNSSLLEPHAASLLDIFQIPYTGSNPMTLALCIDKIKVKKILDFHKIPTPAWDYAYSLEDEINPALNYPLMVKPASTDNSIGITNNSVVTNEKELKTQLKEVIEKLKSPALVEEYIEGDEYDVSILGNDDDTKVLPLSRSVFSKLPKDLWHIYTYESKWGENNVYKKNIIVERPPKNVSAKLQALITEIALDTYNVLDCHDYGRVEIKLDANNNPHVLELNPNPSINRGNCLPATAELAGLNYSKFLEEIIYSAIKRYKNKPSYSHLRSNIL